MPNIYPGIGEGMQAKRRGRSIIIDHLTPPLVKAGLNKDQYRLSVLISEYSRASAQAESLAKEKLKSIEELVHKTGINKDLDIFSIDDNAIEKVEHYLSGIKGSAIPYGFHRRFQLLCCT